MAQFTWGIKRGTISLNIQSKWFQHPIQCMVRISYFSLGFLYYDKFSNPIGSSLSLKESVVFTLALWKMVPERCLAFRCHSCPVGSTVGIKERSTLTIGSHSKGRGRKPFSLGYPQLWSLCAAACRSSKCMWSLSMGLSFPNTSAHTHTKLPCPKISHDARVPKLGKIWYHHTLIIHSIHYTLFHF